jgi:hypothetical protein
MPACILVSENGSVDPSVNNSISPSARRLNRSMITAGRMRSAARQRRPGFRARDRAATGWLAVDLLFHNS